METLYISYLNYGQSEAIATNNIALDLSYTIETVC
jgi:hypothetical protein